MSADVRNENPSDLEGVPHTGEAVLADGHLAEPQAEDFRHAEAAPVDNLWYKRAVFYEVLVRAFHDHDGNGTGDLRGLTRKLDYLEWLGVDCLWLPPFYASPLRDGGYDISDFRAVLPEFGTVEDFVELLDEAHKRGIRVITDLVMNHTSDQHPWFQESRRDLEGPYADFYVWTRRRRTGPTTRCAGSSTGTGSSPTSPTSISRIPRSARR
jgi:maltose alpha-D-glucosyltransferase/alpha-amylase